MERQNKQLVGFFSIIAIALVLGIFYNNIQATNRLDKRVNQLESDVQSLVTELNEYNYMKEELESVNRIVYQMYNLNENDVEEIDRWFWRRYSKLAKAIDNNQSHTDSS